MTNTIPGGGSSYSRMASLKMKKKKVKKNVKKNKR